MHMKFKLLLICLIAILTSCVQKSDSSLNNSSEPRSLQQYPEGFELFFYRFHKDSIYQLNHIMFPLEGEHVNYEGNSVFKWQKENWVLHQAFDESLTDFEKSYQIINGIVIETIRDKYNFSKIERRFAKLGDAWMLIYYSMIRIDNNQ